MSYLLDTNVVSELRKRVPSPDVLSWFDAVPETELYLSVLTIGEVSQGIARLARRDPQQAQALSGWLQGLRANYRDRIVSVTAEIACEWGRLGVPNPVPVVDGLLAATAKVRGWTLVTRNVSDFSEVNVAVHNPFTSAIR